MNKTKETVFAFALALTIGACAALSQVSAEQRAAAYQREGQAAEAACKAYHFDRALGLTNEAPAMTKLCGAK